MPVSPALACPCGGRRQAGQPCERCGRGGKQSRREYDQRRGSAAERGYDAAWQRFRKRYLAEHPLCEDCQATGIVTAATDIHHIAKLRDRLDLKYEDSNLMALCSRCHDVRTRKGE